jgi:hypothetical protein
LLLSEIKNRMIIDSRNSFVQPVVSTSLLESVCPDLPSMVGGSKTIPRSFPSRLTTCRSTNLNPKCSDCPSTSMHTTITHFTVTTFWVSIRQPTLHGPHHQIKSRSRSRASWSCYSSSNDLKNITAVCQSLSHVEVFLWTCATDFLPTIHTPASLFC